MQRNTNLLPKSLSGDFFFILFHMVTSSLQTTTPVDGTTIEGSMTEGIQTEETIGRSATIPGQGTN